MTDPDDPFADLGDSIEEAESDDADQGPETDRRTTTDETTTTMTETTAESKPDTTTSSLDEPAFTFDDATQDAIYARQESLDELGDALAELDLELRKRDLRDVPKREKHDALARLASNHVEELADLIEEARKV